MTVEIINVSSKGQVVLPSGMRNKLDINAGDKLMVYCGEDAIFIKKIKLPSDDEFLEAIKENMEMAKEAGLTEEDIFETIRESRDSAGK